MQKKYLYLQPDYVGKFQCLPAQCVSNCCKRPWTISIDNDTYEKYSQIQPEQKAREITSLIKHDVKNNRYVIAPRPCPFLEENNLCRIQLEYGEEFLSAVCKTHPRVVNKFENFFERTLTLTCPVAAEIILFEREPMKFEFVQLEQDRTTKLLLNELKVPEKFVAHIVDVQIAMISILQERTLSINQRLIVLGFFLDKLDEISADEIDEKALTKLIATYESKKFLAEQVPLMLSSVRFNAKNFLALVLKIFNDILPIMFKEEKYIDAIKDTLALRPDENNFVSLSAVVANYGRIADERKNFLERYSTFLENYLVNEIFLNCYPWRFTESIKNNFAVFAVVYKTFELIIFSATRVELYGRDDLLKLVSLFATQTDHVDGIHQKIFSHVKNFEDMFTLMETLIED